MKQKKGAPQILAAGAAVQLLTGIPAAWGVFQRPVMEEYAFTRAQASMVFAVLVAGYGVGCAIGGLLQDARGPRFAAGWGTLLMGGGFLLAAAAPAGNAPLFLLAYSVPAGVGSAFLAPAVLACAQKWYADRKGLATGVTGAAMGLSGAFLTLFVRGIGGKFGMRACFGALGAVILTVCGAGAAVLKNPPPKPGAPAGTAADLPPKAMVRTAQYKLCVAGVALAAPPVLLFSPDLLQIAADRGMAENLAPLCVVIGAAASAAGRLVCPALSDKAGRKPVLYGVYAGLGIGSAFFALAQNWWVAAAYALLTFFYSGGAAVQPSLNTDLFGLRHAGVNYGFLALGMSAGSLLSYAGSQLLPMGARHWAAGLSAAAGLVCFALVKPLCQNGTTVAKKGTGR